MLAEVRVRDCLFEGNELITPEKLIDSRWKSQAVDLFIMESDVKSIRDYGAAVCEHVVEDLMVFLAHSVVNTSLQKIELQTQDVEDFEEPTDCEWVARHFEDVEVLQHRVVCLLVFLDFIICPLVQKRIEHGWVVQ
jgi:hypothetical protein